MKKIACISWILGFVLIKVFTVAVAAATQEDLYLPIHEVRNCHHTSSLTPGINLLDDDPGSYWGLVSGAGQGWVEFSLEEEALIYGLEIGGMLVDGARLVVEYQKGDQWLPFLGANLKTIPPDGLLDLSYDRVVTKKLRLRLYGDRGNSRLNSVKIRGRSTDTIRYLLTPQVTALSDNTSPFYPVEHLTDGNTYTIWQTVDGTIRSELLFELAHEHNLTNVNIYFTGETKGNFQLEAREGDAWREFASIMAPPGEGWYRLPLDDQNIRTRQVRLIISGAGKLGGLGEIEFWGKGGYSGDELYLPQGFSPQILERPLNFVFPLVPGLVPGDDDPAPFIPESSIKVLYKCTNPAPVTNTVQHHLRVVNTGQLPIDLSTVKLRYWYTKEPPGAQQAHIYWADIGGQYVTAEFKTADFPGADNYLELGFKKQAGILGPGSTVEIQLGFNTANWKDYRQENDYSFDSLAHDFIENKNYTGYIDGGLAWGVEPSGAAAPVSSLQSPVVLQGNGGNYTGEGGDLQALYKCTNPAPVTNSLQHSVRLVNTGSSPVDLSTIKLRYWYTNEPYKPQVANIYWATIGRQHVTARFVAVENITPEADYYLELGFTKGAGYLSPGNVAEIQLGINTADWSNYNQENDYSYMAEAGHFLENPCYTVYKNDKLVWGREPASPALVPAVSLTPVYCLEMSLRGGTGGPVKVEINGELFELFSNTELRDQVIYSKILPAEILQEINYLRILPQSSPAEITSLLLAVRKKDGEQSFPGGKLNDRLLLTPVSGRSEENISLQEKTLLEKVIVHAENSFYAPLYAWVENSWRELTPVESLPGCIIYNGGVLTQKLRLINNGFNSLSEVQVFGSSVTDRAPEVKILWPKDKEEIDLPGWANKNLIGFVDNPAAEITVNGKTVTKNGHYFSVKLAHLGLKPWATGTITVMARDGQGRVTVQELQVSLGKFADFELNLPEEIVYTDRETIEVSGSIRNGKYNVYVNGRQVAVTGNYFAADVYLQEGFNLIKITFEDDKKEFSRIVYRRVVRYGRPVKLTVDWPLPGSHLKTETVVITGTVQGMDGLVVTINDQPVIVNNGCFQSPPLNLAEGENLFIVKAEDNRGEPVTVELTVQADWTPPVLTGITPEEGKITNTTEMLVTGQVIEEWPACVLVNNKPAELLDGEFRAGIVLDEGRQEILIEAFDLAGNKTKLIREVFIDTVPPASFTPQVEPYGWTNNNRPVFTFATTDEESGIDYYAVRVDYGPWIAPVFSPYQFADPLSDGEYDVEVKAVDRAGNETTGAVTVYIDTTPPPAPEGAEAISGIEKITLEWEVPSDEIIGYRIERTPSFTGENYRELFLSLEEREINRYVDIDVHPGTEYRYTLYAIDRAHNYSEPAAPVTARPGMTEKAVPETGGVVKFDICTVTIPEGALSAPGQVVIEEFTAETAENPYAEPVSPVYSFTLLDETGNEIEEDFAEPVTLSFNYVDLALPEDYNLGLLGIYWYNEEGGYWEKLEPAYFDFETGTISAYVRHFSEYQIRSSDFVSPSLESYYEMGISPYQSYFQNNIESVSTTGGGLTLSATDLVLPGRDGFDLVIMRIYDSTFAQQEKIIEANNEVDNKGYRKTPVDTFGNGWALNIPWIEKTDKGRFLRLPEGQTIKIEFKNKKFVYHKGIHFTLEQPTKNGPYYLTMNDGTKYEFDSAGKVKKKISPSGKNEISYNYSGRQLSYIIDSLGRRVEFTYQNNAITKIKVDERSLEYFYDENGNLIEAQDPEGRKTGYNYETFANLETGFKYRVSRRVEGTATSETGESNDIRGSSSGSSDTLTTYTVDLLTNITYPTGESSGYSYTLYDQKASETWSSTTTTRETKRVTHNGEKVRVTYEYTTTTSGSAVYAGQKIVVTEHAVAGKITRYTYELNEQVGSPRSSNSFLPKNSYISACKIEEGFIHNEAWFPAGKTIEEEFLHIQGNKLVSVPTSGLYMNIISFQRDYEGVLLVTRKTKIDGGNVEVEKVTYEYDLPIRAVTQETYYRGGQVIYRIISQYDDWGNLTYRRDTSRELVEEMTYHNHARIKNLVKTKEVKNYNPLIGNYSTVTTTYYYNDDLGKPERIEENDGEEIYTTLFTYHNNGNLATRTEPNGLLTKIFYDEKDAFPTKKEIYGVEDADGNTTVIETYYGYNWQTGMKEWEIDPRGYETKYEYDKLNRLVKVILPDEEGREVVREYEFDDDNNTCLYWDEEERETLFIFDGLGQLTEIVKYLDITKYPNNNYNEIRTKYEYDPLGRIVKVIDPRGSLPGNNPEDYTTRYEYDGLGRVTKVIYPRTASDITNPCVTLEYDDTTNTVTIIDENGDRVIERSDWANRLVEAKQYNTFEGTTEIYTWQFIYDALGNKIGQVNPLGHVTNQYFNARSLLTKIELPQVPAVLPGSEQPVNHRPTLTFEYDEMGNRTAETSALGNAVDPDGYKIEYEYDRLGRLLKTIAKATDPFTGEKEVIVTKHYYDPAGNRIKTVDPNNGEWKYDYSARGWLVREEDPEGNVTRYRYDRVGNKTHETDPRGSENRDAFTTVYHYDDLNRLYLTEFPDGTSVEFAYDPAGNKIMERDANQVQTTYVYDARNRVERVYDNLGRLQLEYKYDPKGNLIEEKDALNNITRREYDSLGRLRRVIYPAGNRESFSYDALGNRTEVADGRGNITRYTYNSLGWLTTIRDPLWNVTEYRYDPNGNMVVMVAANGLTTVNRYDELNRLVERTDPPGVTTLFSYDGAGNLLRKKDPRGTIWQYEYYANHLLKKLHLTGADNSEYEVRYQYDAAGNRRLVVDSNNTIRYNYDETGQYKPDPLNRINSVDRYFDGASYRTEYRYDPAGLLTGIKYPDAQAWLAYNYNNLNQLQEVVGFTAPQGITYETDGVVSSLNLSNNIVTAFNYDNNRRLLQLVTSGPEEILKLDYAYDENNNIIRLNDRLYQYDARNQLTRAYTPDRFLEEEKTPGSMGLQTGDYLGRSWLNFYTDPGAVVGIDYNASSIGIDFGYTVPAVKKIVLVPGKEHQNHRVRAETLDLFYSNDNSTYTLISRENWTYVQDENGVITLTLEETLSARYLKVHVKFDDRDLDFNPVDRATFLNELAKMLRVYQEASSRTEEYQYDAVGNRTELRLQLVQTFYYTYSYYENSDRLKTDGKYAYAYDAAGNLVKKGNTFTISGETVSFVTSGDGVEYWEYEYDLLNRLTAVKKNGVVVAEYGYDPEGFRVVRRARGETTHYVFEGTEPVFEKNITTGEQRSYVFALGKYLARVDGAIGDPEAPVYYMHTDHLGSIRAVTDEAGTVVWSVDYLAFGTRFGETVDASFEQWKGFTGKEYDPDTGLYYFNARWYDQSIGRFISEDPARDGTNWYIYCRNNPLILLDPSGKTPWSANKLLSEYHDDIIKIAHKHDISPVLLASVVYNENVLRWAYHDLEDTVAAYLSLAQGHDPSIGLCQIQVSNAILLDFGLEPKKFAELTREQQRQIKDMAVATLDPAYREYYIEKLKDPLTNIDYAARYLKFLGEARDYESPELWLSDYNRGLSQYETPLQYGYRYYWIINKYDFDDYEISDESNSLESIFYLDIFDVHFGDFEPRFGLF